MVTLQALLQLVLYGKLSLGQRLGAARGSLREIEEMGEFLQAGVVLFSGAPHYLRLRDSEIFPIFPEVAFTVVSAKVALPVFAIPLGGNAKTTLHVGENII